MTGLHVASGGAQQIYDIEPDLTCLGKIIGGGLPVGAYGGRAEIMDMVAPLGPMYQAGTLSGNPLAMAAGIATLKKLKADGTKIYADLERKSELVANRVAAAAKDAGLPINVNRLDRKSTRLNSSH